MEPLKPILTEEEANRLLRMIGVEYGDSKPLHAACVGARQAVCQKCGLVGYICASMPFDETTRCPRCTFAPLDVVNL